MSETPEIIKTGRFSSKTVSLPSGLIRILVDLITTIQAVGGLAKDDNGVYTCVADPDWLDLAYVVKNAHETLLTLGIPVLLTIKEVEGFEELYP